MAIPGSFVKLNYLSTRAAGYLSLLRILLTPPPASSPVSPLAGLSRVHVRAWVQGRLFQRWYPAGPGLVHRLVWNKTDVYGQEVWGLTQATGKTCFFLLYLLPSPLFPSFFYSLFPAILELSCCLLSPHMPALVSLAPCCCVLACTLSVSSGPIHFCQCFPPVCS